MTTCGHLFPRVVIRDGVGYCVRCGQPAAAHVPSPEPTPAYLAAMAKVSR